MQYCTADLRLCFRMYTQKASFLMQRLFHEFDTCIFDPIKWVAAQESLFSGLGTIPVLAHDIDQNA